MSEASTVLTGITYLLSVIGIHHTQWLALTREGISDVEDMIEFDDDDNNNVVTDLRRPQDIFHAEVPAVLGVPEVLAVAGGLNVPAVLHVPEILPQARVDARTEKQAPFVLSALAVKKLKMTGELARHYTGLGRSLTEEK